MPAVPEPTPDMLRAMAIAAGLDVPAERARVLAGDASRLLRLYQRLLHTAPGETPPAAVFRVERRRHD